jgi:hypothetical protein
MEKFPQNESAPNPFESAEKFSSAMDKIETARRSFLDRVKKSREDLYGEVSEINNLKTDELLDIFTDFETDRIEDFLNDKKDSTFINRAEYNRNDLTFMEPDASTLIDSKNKILQRGESSTYSEDVDQKNNTEAFYRIGPLGTLEIMVTSSYETLPDEATAHPIEKPFKLPSNQEVNFPDENPSSFDIMNPVEAKKIADFINSVADFLKELYSNPNLEILYSENSKNSYEIKDLTENE